MMDSAKEASKGVQLEFEQDILTKNKVQIKCFDILTNMFPLAD